MLLRRILMPRGTRYSLRARLLWLFLIATIPALGLTLYTTFEAYQQALMHAQSNAQRVVELAASGEKQLIAQVRQLLVTLAELPEIRSGDNETCQLLLANLLVRQTGFLNLGVIAPNGDLLCSALPAAPSTNLADRSYFQRALQTHDFAVGEYQIGRVTKQPSLNFGYPILDDSGQIQAVVYAALDVTAIHAVIADVHLPADAALTLVDHNGTILTRSPNPEQWAGQTLPDVPIVHAMLASHGPGQAEVAGLDGVERLYAFIPVVEPAHGGLYVSYGVPSKMAFAEASRVFLRNLIGLAVMLTLGLSTLWVGSRELILRQLSILLKASERLSHGDLSVRIGKLTGPQELRHLASVFDQMAESLQQREAQLQQGIATQTSTLEVL